MNSYWLLPEVSDTPVTEVSENVTEEQKAVWLENEQTMPVFSSHCNEHVCTVLVSAKKQDGKRARDSLRVPLWGSFPTRVLFLV